MIAIGANSNGNDNKALLKQKGHSSKHESILILEIPKNQNIVSNDTNANKDTVIVTSVPPLSNSTQQINDTASTPQQVKTKLYSCPKCQQCFSRPHNLKSHLATHSTDRPYQCDKCDAHFRRQHDLKRHQKLHTGERPFVCQVCSRSFARSDALNRHQRVDGDIRCSMAQRHCIIPFNVAPLQQTIPVLSSNTRKSSSPSSPSSPSASSSMTFSFSRYSTPTQPTTINKSPPQQNLQLHLESPSPSPSPSPPPSFSLPSPSSSSLSVSPPMPLLPSPSTLTVLPLSNEPNLSPLYNIPTSDTPTKYDHQQHQQQHPFITVVPPSPSFVPSFFCHHQKKLPAPSSSSPPSMYIPPFTTNTTDIPSRKHQYSHCRDQEIIRLKQEHERQMDRLANEVHDLEVENKVLRSLVLQTNRSVHPEELLSDVPGINDDDHRKKRSRQSSLDTFSSATLFSDGTQQNTSFTKKSRYSF